MTEERSGYLGTYFSKDVILKLVSIAKIFSWVVVGIYGAQWIVQGVSMFLQIVRGFWMGMGYTDYANNIIFWFEQPLRGVVYFIVMQAIAQVLLMFMDMEDSARRAARAAERSGAARL